MVGKDKPCCCPDGSPCPDSGLEELRPLGVVAGPEPPGNDISCCGGPAPAPADPMERPGYALLGFVRGFRRTPAGPVPLVATRLDRADRRGTLLTRLGIGRDSYRVAPGLYGVGDPGPASPVLVTANYKLTFDHVRAALDGADAWLLVLDTRGVNVWCAAGKGVFSTDEVARRVRAVGLDKVVEHRELVLPQLGATGVAAHKLRKACGFGAVFGPVRARDLRRFLEAGNRADQAMRRVTFTLAERLVLAPVEIWLWRRWALRLALAAFVLSGIGPGIFSLSRAWERGLTAVAVLAAGLAAGTLAVPALLPWLPGRTFALKGAVAGLAFGAGAAWLTGGGGGLEWTALLLSAGVLGSWLGMNFTGSTPYTSPSGVEKEMRRAIPVQAGAALLAVVCWVGSAFS